MAFLSLSAFFRMHKREKGARSPSSCLVVSFLGPWFKKVFKHMLSIKYLTSKGFKQVLEVKYIFRAHFLYTDTFLNPRIVLVLREHKDITYYQHQFFWSEQTAKPWRQGRDPTLHALLKKHSYHVYLHFWTKLYLLEKQCLELPHCSSMPISSHSVFLSEIFTWHYGIFWHV